MGREPVLEQALGPVPGQAPGPGQALALNCLVQGIVWFIFLQPVGYSLLVLDAIIVGACGGGIAAAQGVLLTRLFGIRNFARAMGLVTLFTVPFTFGISPLASRLYFPVGRASRAPRC